jgi:diguanylate cyclase (GGDEF)-like protein/PAS domain S-box-containing protein
MSSDAKELSSVEQLFKGSAESFIVIDQQGLITTWSKGAENYLGYLNDQVIGKNIFKLLFEEQDQNHLYDLINHFLTTRSEKDFSNKILINIKNKQKNILPVEMTINPILIDDQYCFHLFIRDKSAEHAAEQKASNLAAVIDGNQEATITTDQQGIINSWNKAAEQLYNFKAEQQTGKSITELVSAEHRQEIKEVLQQEQFRQTILELPQITKTGIFHGQISVNQLSNNNLLWSVRDISQYKSVQQELIHLQDHQPLTGLPNRQSFINQVDKLINTDGHQGGSIIVIDLDNFRIINDSYGHDTGDDLLKEIGELLYQLSDSEDFLAHLGIDEFAILVQKDQAEAYARTLIHEIQELTDQRFKIDLTASAGIIEFDSRTKRDADQLLSATDASLYDAKELGGNQVVVFSQNKLTRLDLAKRIRLALENDSLTLYSQPIVDLKSGETVQRELLLRLNDPELGVLSPHEFLASASKLGLIGDIDRWVACKGIEEAARGGAVEINLSGAAMTDQLTLQVIKDKLQSTEVDPNQVIFEITETIAISNLADAASFAHALKGLGARFALDDFGTGFGSFTYLKHLPVAVIKIDGDFIKNIANSEIDQRIVQAIVFIAQGLELSTVAEWVEDDQALEKLKEWGVDHAQGYLFGEPQPLDNKIITL